MITFIVVAAVVVVVVVFGTIATLCTLIGFNFFINIIDVNSNDYYYYFYYYYCCYYRDVDALAVAAATLFLDAGQRTALSR